MRAKKEVHCTNCNKVYITWQGICDGCSKAGTIQETLLGTQKSRGTPEAQRIRRRAKNSEREIARKMINADGVDPAWAHIASSTGRIGHITGIRVDAVSKHYVTENKNRKMPSWVIDAWLLINMRAKDFDKHALLHVEPPNMARDYLLNGMKYKLDTMAIITQPRHEELIKAERALYDLAKDVQDGGDIATAIVKMHETLK